MRRAMAGFLKALREPPVAPSFVLALSYIGFGTLCHGSGIGLAPALYMTIFIFALPAQVVLVDQLVRGTPLFAAALAVAFTGIRLLPMTVALLPYLRTAKQSRLIEYVAAHFVAVTVWIESMRRVPLLPKKMRLAYFFGLAFFLIGVSTLGTIVGYAVASEVPHNVAGALVFLTPVYFFLGLLSNARAKEDFAPIALGFAGAPIFMSVAPSFDLVLTGIVGGTAATLLRRRKGRGPAKAPKADV